MEEKNIDTAKWTLGRRGRRIVCSNCETPVPFHKDGKRNYLTAWYSPYCPKCGKLMRRECQE